MRCGGAARRFWPTVTGSVTNGGRLLVGVPEDLGGGLRVSADVILHRRIDALMPHEHHQHLRHDLFRPAFSKGAAKVVSAGELDLPSTGFSVDLHVGLLADRHHSVGDGPFGRPIVAILRHQLEEMFVACALR